MCRTGKAASAKHTSTHIKVPTIFLNQHVSGHLACAENAVFGLIDAHRLVDAALAPRMRRLELPTLFGFVPRQAIRCVAVNLVCRCEDEYGIRCELPGRFKQH